MRRSARACWATLPSVTALPPLYSTDRQWRPFHQTRRLYDSAPEPRMQWSAFELDRTVGERASMSFFWNASARGGVIRMRRRFRSDSLAPSKSTSREVHRDSSNDPIGSCAIRIGLELRHRRLSVLARGRDLADHFDGRHCHDPRGLPQPTFSKEANVAWELSAKNDEPVRGHAGSLH